MLNAAFDRQPISDKTIHPRRQAAIHSEVSA